MFSPSGNHGKAEKGNLPTQASDDQIRYCWQNSKQEIIIIHSKGWAWKSMLWSLEFRHPISLILAQSPSSPSLTFLCHSSLYHIWLPSEMSILSHSYLPNLQALLLLPSFATLVSTIYGYPQICPSYLTHICPFSKLSLSYLPLPTYYIWLTPTNITFTRNANIHGFCFLDELIQTLSLKQW